MKQACWSVYDTALQSRLFLGTARYPSPAVVAAAIEASDTDVITVGLRRQAPEQGGGDSFWTFLKEQPCRVLPNTAGCSTAKEAVTLAQMSREIFETNSIMTLKFVRRPVRTRYERLVDCNDDLLTLVTERLKCFFQRPRRNRYEVAVDDNFHIDLISSSAVSTVAGAIK